MIEAGGMLGKWHSTGLRKPKDAWNDNPERPVGREG